VEERMEKDTIVDKKSPSKCIVKRAITSSSFD